MTPALFASQNTHGSFWFTFSLRRSLLDPVFAGTRSTDHIFSKRLHFSCVTMKFNVASTALACLASLALADEDCASEKEIMFSDATKLSFVGFDPTVERITNTGVGNKVVLKNYGEYHVDYVEADGVMTITRGEPCEGGEPGTGSAATKALLFGVPMLFGKKSGIAASTVAALWFSFFGPTAYADDTTAECSVVPVDVEIYVDAMVEDIVNMKAKAGKYEECPPETQYWEHDPSVFGGYSGCTAERGLYPCASDALGVRDEGGAFYPLSGPEVWDGDQCVATGVGMETQLFWARSGHPMDKSELVARTGGSPVVTLPFTRMPYPSYARGVDVDTDPQDESNDARVKAKEMLEFIGAFTPAQLDEFDVTITEGAEQGMVHLYAAKALEIARTTCNRNIFVLSEVPAYGYSNSYAAGLVNNYASSFYNGTECLCAADNTCFDPTVTITTRGWFPGTDFPVEMGGDGVMYVATSDSPASPWFETLVFPENPSGVLKVPQHPVVNRRVCDGVYLWPMYFGARDFAIPNSEVPDCSMWSFSISKIYSAAARAGWIMYKEEPASSHDAVVTAIGSSQTLTHGSLSQWTWEGQLQLMNYFMAKPLDDPTSWIGAYSGLLKEKWDYIVEGFADCPVAQVSNPYSGAYVWFVKEPEYIGLDEGASAPGWLRDVIGVRAFAYNWGFRGADPADYYGEGYGLWDFTRMQLYRDVNVYKEIGRRAKIVCNDLDASIGGTLISFNQWAAAGAATRNRRLSGAAPHKNRHERKLHLKEAVPDLTEEQLEFLAINHEEAEAEREAVESCAPEYSTACLFEVIDERPDAFF